MSAITVNNYDLNGTSMGMDFLSKCRGQHINQYSECPSTFLLKVYSRELFGVIEWLNTYQAPILHAQGSGQIQRFQPLKIRQNSCSYFPSRSEDIEL